MSFQLAR